MVDTTIKKSRKLPQAKEHTCKYCGEIYLSASNNTKFCSPKCRDANKYYSNRERNVLAARKRRRERGIYKKSQVELPGSRWVVYPYDNRYAVSDKGQVKYLPHGTIRKPYTLKSGYQTLLFNNSGKHVSRYVHRMVIETFIGCIPKGMHVCHNDGNKQNNTLVNLRVDTVSGNARDRRIHGTAPLGETHRWHKLTESQVLEIRSSDLSIKELAEKYGMSRGGIGHILNRDTWTHI